MKIIFLGKYNPTEILTGPEKVAKRIYDLISKNNEAIFIEYFFEGEKYSLFQKLFGYEETEENILRLGLVRLLFYLFKYKPGIIHIITFERFAFTAFIYKIFSSVKIVYTVHGIIRYENSLRAKIPIFRKIKDLLFEQALYSFADKLLFLSDTSISIAKKYFKVDSDKIEMISNGADEIFYLQPSLYNNSDLRIVFVGDIYRKEKGFNFLVSALNKLTINAELYIISDLQPENPHLFNDSLKINFVKRMPTIEYSAFLSDKDMIISSSSYEQFSISTLEGMAAGLIPVITKNAGLSKFVRDNYNGFVIEFGDEFKLKNIIEDLAVNQSKRMDISQNARKIYHELNWEKIARRYLDIFKRLIL